MKVGVPRETFPGERRVAMVPSVLPALAKVGVNVVVESSAGEDAGWPTWPITCLVGVTDRSSCTVSSRYWKR